ncbi:efflux RND transporter periplasmic adaptor subunit [Kozakia baliensis]|uniref:Efflux transporter periplasmic adaptor subunit n=1 Tax=Kozakia baliensis TaxID=153496 RepID=A0A1D8UUS2_9PROT|nr:efflux RND transporter periplasmic adaptor subunit [Kozakia baliensis]AOX17396.1 efflux transporter periplasmic adaptor subunit [Kozakia baliensis]GBR30331.1 multidrug efflux pump acriflavin resistance protein AcrB/AcrD/AcrF [Kozakia baliensis NRIC 0488]GEL63155.1 RND transporter MFP subunit [Kozakia baliensis]
MNQVHSVGQHRKGRGRLILLIILAIAIFLAIWGVLQRTAHYNSLTNEAEDLARARVSLVSPQPGPNVRKLNLPANLSAWYQAPIYAQVSGYVKMWYKDYGAHVKTGDLLAEINTPSLDAQYEAAKANYNVVMARYKLAVITAKRWAALRGTQAVSRQEVDVQAANAAAEKAQVDQAQHEVERYEALENFKKIVAPFDGIVTSRRVNVGDYVNAGGGDVNARGNASELFTVADIHRMRVFVSVPQDYASVISKHLTAKLTVPQYAEREYNATFLATAQAFNPATRTVTTELTVNNDDSSLWPDSYATAHFTAPGDPGVLIVPVNALIFRAQGTQLAKVINNRVHLVDVTVGINYGTTIQILKGLKANDQIVANPTADMLEGDEVKVVPTTRGYNDAVAAPRKNAPNPHDDTRAMPEDDASSPEDGARR